MTDPNMTNYDDHALLCAHNERLKYMNTEISELKKHISVVETKCDCIYDMTSSLKTLTAQMISMDANISEMKTQFKEDIHELGETQKGMGEKINKLEINSLSYVEDKMDSDNMHKRIKEKIIDFVVGIILAILLLGLFPQLSHLI